MIGQTLGHYRIVEQIGAGGMGVVYRAWDTQLQRTVAIKLLGERVPADETARARLLEEARTASALNHPNICTIYEVGEADGQAYITMEYVEGQPLSALAPGEGLPVETAVHYGTQIADALAHAHEHGVVHRDLKSSNVVVTPEGRAKVLDFGLAKRLRKEELSEATQSRVSLTEPGAIAGTLHYLAPEVLRGEEASPRSDLWALGVVLYEVATGQLPFKGQTGFELTAAILRETPAPLPPGVPAGLRGIVQRCLAKEPAQRYQRAGEVRAALEAVQSDSAIAPAAPQPRPPARPRTLAAVVALVLAVAALLVAFVGLNVSGWRERLFGRAGPARIESLAVLPLENLSGDPAQDYFADGMTEALIADLAQIGNLRVISRTSVMRYKGTKKSLPEIARELKVDAVVEGSVLRSGEQVRITAQLIHAATDRHLWARSYERDLRDILALHDLRGRTELLHEFDKVPILCHHRRARLPRRVENNLVRRMKKLKRDDVLSFNCESLAQPNRYRRWQLGIALYLHRQVKVGWFTSLAAYWRQACKSLGSRYGISARISSAVKPEANKSRTSETRTRMLRMQGRPPHCAGSVVIRELRSS